MVTPVNGEGSFPTLIELSLDETVKSFLSGRTFSSSSFQALKKEIASGFYSKLPLPTNENLRTIGPFVENDEYWKRACNLKGNKSEEHGLSHKRMFFELHFEQMFEGIEDDGREAIINRMRPFVDFIYTVKLCGPKGRFPIDFVCSNLSNLTSINLKHASGLNLKESMPKAIASSPLLTYLVLTESQINDEDIARMVDPLVDSSALLHLDLSHNRICFDGTRAIAEKLIAPSDSILTCLDLSGNKISSEGASIIAPAIATNESLQSLTLRLNNIGDEGGKDLFEGLAQNIVLRHFNMSANKLASDSAATLLQILEVESQDRALESIVLTSNAFSEDDLIRLNQCRSYFLDVRTSYGPPMTNGSVASEMPS